MQLIKIIMRAKRKKKKTNQLSVSKLFKRQFIKEVNKMDKG